MLEKVKNLFLEEEGQGMAEYGLILALVALVVIGALTLLGGNIANRMNDVSEKLE